MRRAFALLSVALVGAVALGQGLPNPFDVGLGVRAMGFGGAYIALAEGTEALLTNPAGLARSKGIHADSSLSSVMGLYSVTWVAGAAPNFGAGLGYLGVGGIMDPAGNPLAFSHLAAVVGAGFDLTALRVFPFPASGGATIKYHRVQIADEAGSGFALDVGLLGQMPTPLGPLRFGFALRELGFGPTLGEAGDGWSTDLAAGVALVNPLGFLIVADLTAEYTALGVGWSAMGLFEVRAGMRLQAGLQWAFGLGVQWGMFLIDYALLTHPVLSASHRFGFGVRF